MGSDVRFGVLGALQGGRGGVPLRMPGSAVARRLLGVLLLSAEPLPAHRLLRLAWADRVDQVSRGNLHVAISRLRAWLEAQTGGALTVEHHAQGYCVTGDLESVDIRRFRRHLAVAATAEHSGRRYAELASAMALLRGPVLAELPGLDRDDPLMRTTDDEIDGAVIDFAAAAADVDRADEAVAPLQLLAARRPFDEPVHAWLIETLTAAGRPAEALVLYEAFRNRLVGELGVAPSIEVRRAHAAVLRADGAARPTAEQVETGEKPLTPGVLREYERVVADPGPLHPDGAAIRAALEAVDPPGSSDPPPRAGSEPGSRDDPTGPRQLPADVRAFVGREAEFAALDQVLATGLDESSPSVVLISGTAGVGKSALAVRWGHRARASFPGGQLHVNLRGYDPERPLSPQDALADLLCALGVPGREIPQGLDRRAGLYRSRTTGRRMLVVIDNASSVEQVAPLLPGSGSCLVLVTSRSSLPGLVALHGAERITLDLLPPPDAVGLLRLLIGNRVDREPSGAADLATVCARLPLALRIAAESAAAQPDVALADLVAELGDHRRRLDGLDTGHSRAEVRAVFSWSYQQLPPAAARAFRFLGLQPGEGLDVEAVAALLGVDVIEARQPLDVLVRASLVRPAGADRYGMHDLLRVYAAERADEQDPAQDRNQAITRLFDHYLSRSVVVLEELSARGPVATDRSVAARAWIEAERSNLVAACRYGAEYGWHRFAIDLAETLYRYLDAAGPVDEAVKVMTSAVSAAQVLGDLEAQGRLLAGLGRLHRRLGRLGDAAATYRQALALRTGPDENAVTAEVLHNLGRVHWRLGEYGEAKKHYRQAASRYRSLGDQAGEAGALVGLALVDLRQGDRVEGERLLRSALERFGQVEDRFSETYVLSLLARLSERPDDVDHAAERLEDGLATVRRSGDRTAEAYALTDLAAVDARRGQLTRAALNLRRAVVLHQRIGDRASAAEAHNDLALVLRTAGDPAPARAESALALVLSREIGDRYEQARAHAGLAATLEGDEARAHLELAEQLFDDLAVPPADWSPVRTGGSPRPTAP